MTAVWRPGFGRQLASLGRTVFSWKGYWSLDEGPGASQGGAGRPGGDAPRRPRSRAGPRESEPQRLQGRGAWHIAAVARAPARPGLGGRGVGGRGFEAGAAAPFLQPPGGRWPAVSFGVTQTPPCRAHGAEPGSPLCRRAWPPWT